MLVLCAIGAGALCAAAPAAALTIKSATVTSHPTKGDGFKVKGELGPLDALDLDAAAGVVFELDGAVAGFRTAELKRSRTRLTYKGPRASPGIAQLVLDLKRRRFGAKGTGLLLPGIPGPLTLRLAADGASACAVLPLERAGKPPKKPPTRPKTTRYRLPRKHPGLPCLLDGRASAHPPAVVVDAPTSVRFEAVLAPALVPDGGAVRVRAVDASGLPGDPPVCTLADDGGPASGDLVAGDGLRACAAIIAGAALGDLAFVLEATAGGTPLTSPPLTLPVVPPLTDDAVAAAFAAQDAARAIWDAEEAALGDSLNARLEAIRQIALLPDVAEAGLSPNGLDVFIRFTSGVTGGLMLSARFGDDEPPGEAPGGERGDGTTAVDAGAPATAARAPAAGEIAGVPATPATADASGATAARAAPFGAALPQGTGGGSGACPPADERTLIGNRKALILKTSYFGASDDWPTAQAALAGSCLPLDVTVQDLTPSAIVGAAAYSTLFLSTHGYLDRDGAIVIVTDLTATAEQAQAAGEHHEAFGQHDLFVIGLPASIVGGNRNVWVMRPAYLRRIAGSFDDGLVHASHCYGAHGPAEAAAFRAKGARTFFGFDGLVSYGFARLVTGSVLPDLAERLLETGDAFARAVKIDPTPVIRPPIGKGIARVPQAGATFHMFGDAHLAYVGDPTIMPETTTIMSGESADFTVEVEGKNDCELVNRWGSGTSAGQIADTEETTETTATYQAGGGTGEDNVSVLVRAPGDDTPSFGVACASVEVTGCGDLETGPGEECDGPDDAACPGQCLPDCTCSHDPECGNGVREGMEICDGADDTACDLSSPTGVGYCDADCMGCAVCGDGMVDPNEECDVLDDSPCPGACKFDCTCGCAPGDPAGCPASQCCDPDTKECCTPRRVDSDPACFATAAGCCGESEFPGGLCGPGSATSCPVTCASQSIYYCYACDNKIVQGVCTLSGSCN